MDDVYSHIKWESLVLIAAMLPMGTALEKSGGMSLIAASLTETLGNYGPLAVLSCNLRDDSGSRTIYEQYGHSGATCTHCRQRGHRARRESITFCHGGRSWQQECPLPTPSPHRRMLSS